MRHELRHVRAFLKVAELQSFTRAAAELHVSQSALTVQVKQLEEELGVLLFDRNKRGVAITAAGRDLLGPPSRCT
jgi:LysR family transcriptional regulator, carnitine catabolism transcriptional activator